VIKKFKKNKIMENWKEFKTEEAFYSIVKKSDERTQVIFKDSVSCGISAHAKHKLMEGYDQLKGKADFNYLDLLSHRSISNLIALELDVKHHSPQIIVLKNGIPVHTVTHHSIDPDSIVNFL
jgi:bacillithiol system protein YtxJ